jgi:hypothetical protein
VQVWVGQLSTLYPLHTYLYGLVLCTFSLTKNIDTYYKKNFFIGRTKVLARLGKLDDKEVKAGLLMHTKTYICIGIY